MRSILIIEGDQAARLELKESLRKEGFKVYFADRLKTGLDKAREKHPDLILTELDFPDGDGFQLIQELKSDSELTSIPIVILAQRAGELDKVLALEMGADDYVVKPACSREITARIRGQFRYIRVKPKEKNNGLSGRDRLVM